MAGDGEAISTAIELQGLFTHALRPMGPVIRRSLKGHHVLSRFMLLGLSATAIIRKRNKIFAPPNNAGYARRSTRGNHGTQARQGKVFPT